MKQEILTFNFVNFNTQVRYTFYRTRITWSNWDFHSIYGMPEGDEEGRDGPPGRKGQRMAYPPSRNIFLPWLPRESDGQRRRAVTGW